MTMQPGHIDEWINKAFGLAFFLHGDRETAKTIALNAMAKLETASTAQFKRNYYTPTGRAETSRATRSRVSMNDLQLLQRLVFVESEAFERQHENTEKVCQKRLLTYFIKHLVRISLKRNSFYVTLGISRILHNYATVEAMEIYNVVIQNPDRVHDDYYYRSRKGLLMKEMKARFGDLLDIVRLNRGEERFRSLNGDDDLGETVNESLRSFTPWNSACAIPDEFDPLDDVIKPFHFDKDDPDAEHRIEVNRIHAALHPNCFDRLTSALNLPSSKEKMEIPKFMITNNYAGIDDDDWGGPPQLDADELQTIKGVLSAQAESRKAMTANLLRVIVDGRQQAIVDLDSADSVNFDLDEGAELIELTGKGRSGEVTIATHLLRYEDLEKGVCNYEAFTDGGRKVSFRLVPSLDSYGEVAGLSCTVGYEETSRAKRAGTSLRSVSAAVGSMFGGGAWGLRPAMTFGALLIVAALGWLIYQRANNSVEYVGVEPVHHAPDPVPARSQPPTDDNNDNKEVVQGPGQPPVERNEVRRGPAQRPPQTKAAPDKKQRPGLARDELVAVNDDPQHDKSYTDENGILRLPLREQTGREPNERVATRGNSKIRGKAFAEIRQVYIEITGDAVFGNQIRQQIAANIGDQGSFRITGDKESADAALKVYVRHESDADTRDEASVTAIVRMVNARGFVVYPNIRGVSGWKYVGTAAKLPGRIAADLRKMSEAGPGRKTGEK